MPRLPLRLRHPRHAVAFQGPTPADAASGYAPAPPRTRSFALPRPRPELLGLLVLAAILNLWALDQNGWANEYYAGAVRSMSTSWHAFLYGSFDASGVMTVDKPPLAPWVQALSVKAFGFHSLSILVPQALMGVAAVGLVYDMTRRHWGRAGGFAAGLVLALTPMTVAISRHNNPDALLILCCVAALWCVVRALEDGRTRWLVGAGVAVGLGFEAKMAVALMVVPGIAAAWLWIAPRGRLAALRQLLWGGAAMVGVGAAWPLLVVLTPASDRPWISGTADNSIVSLILGYNGLGRLTGQAGGPAGGGAAGGGAAGGGAAGGAAGGVLGGGGTGGGAGVLAGRPGGGGGPGGVFGGDTGVFRLLDQTLGAQAGWLLGVAVVGLIGIVVATRLRRSDARSGWLLAVGGAFGVTAVAFSFASGIFHPYYVSLLAPFTACLVGATVALMLGGGQLARVLAPLTVAAGVIIELAVLNDNPGELGWLPPVLIAIGLAAAVALALALSPRVRAVAVATVIAALLLAPATWAVQTLGHPTNGTFPAGGSTASSAMGGPGGGGPGGGGRPNSAAPPAGAPGATGTLPGATAQGRPALPGASGAGGAGTVPGRGAMAGGGPFGQGSGSLTEVLAYAKQHGGGSVAVSSQMSASSAIANSGADVVAIGGFSGRESEVSVSWLAQAIRDGQIRWVLTDGSGGAGPQDGRTGASAVMAAVAKTCRLVPSLAYASSAASGSGSTGGSLYDCSGFANALEATAG